MERLRISPHRVAAEALQPAVDALRRGGVVAFPTDTLYGLAVDPRSAAAVRRLFEVKQRAPDQPIPLIAGSVEQVIRDVGRLTPLAERLASRGWPGPLTLIIPASPALCPDVHLGTGRVAVRVPDLAVARELALAFGGPITSTSANVSGAPPASDADAVVASLGDRIDVAIDAGALEGGPPSTIVDATGSEPALVRAGAVAWERVLKFLS